MKKRSLIFSLLTMLSCAMVAQSDLRFGLKFSPNLSWSKPDSKDLESTGSRFGYTFGLMADFNLGSKENYAFGTGIYLNNTGGKFTRPDDSTGVALENKLKLQYIEVPLTIKLKTNEVGYITYFGLVGIGTAFNIRAKADQELVGPMGSIVTEEDVDVSDNTNLFKASIIAGAGIEYNITGETRIMAGITYNGGFTNTSDGVKDVDGNDVKLLQNYLELSLGVFF